MDRRNCTLEWDRRIARALALSAEHASARDALAFYGALAEYQRSLFCAAGECRPDTEFIEAVDLDSASAAVPEFLGWLERRAPAPLASSARALRDTRTDWQGLMRQCLEQPDSDASDAERMFVAEALLQPYAEAAARARPETLARRRHTRQCPICAGLPCVGALREEGQGAKRTLLCARCLTEWDYLRASCPGCGEERFEALPVYTADGYPHVRIDSCDTCHTYVKTIDLTRNALAVPLVDDIATVALDLWAMDHGYRRLRTNLLRTSEPAPPLARA